MSSTITALTSGGGLAMAGDTSGQLELKTNNGTTAVTIDASQNMVINGTTAVNTGASTGNLTINGSSNAIVNYTVGGVAKGWLYHSGTDFEMYNNVAGNNKFFTNGTERMRITSAGEVLVGTTTTSVGEKMKVAGSNNVFVVRCSNASGAIITSNASGTASYDAAIFCNNGDTYTGVGSISVSGSSTTYSTSSDYRLKENVLPMTGALATVSALKPVTYKWKVDGSDGQGFIAHELAEIVPDCVTGEKDEVQSYTDEDGNEQTRIKPQGIDTSFLVATLTAAIQELNAKVDAQALEIQALKGVA